MGGDGWARLGAKGSVEARPCSALPCPVKLCTVRSCRYVDYLSRAAVPRSRESHSGRRPSSPTLSACVQYVSTCVYSMYARVEDEDFTVLCRASSVRTAQVSGQADWM